MQVMSGDKWSYKRCKAPVTSSPPTNQHPALFRPDVLPVAQPLGLEHCWRENCHSMELLTPSSSGIFQRNYYGLTMVLEFYQIITWTQHKICTPPNVKKSAARLKY